MEIKKNYNNNYNERKKKIPGQKSFMGYCPDCIVRNENFVLQGKVCIAT